MTPDELHADPPPRPVPPEPGDCCGGGCAACVFDVYERELQAWSEAVERIDRERQARDTRNPAG